MWYAAYSTPDAKYGAVNAETEVMESDIIEADENTLTLWYTDEALSDYLLTAALLYQKDTGVKVNPILVSGVNYLEEINYASIGKLDEAGNPMSELPMPDVYLTTHDNLLRAYLAGLAAPISDGRLIMKPSYMPQTALHAVSCYDQYVGYPLYFETNIFLYNKTYMSDIAKNKIEDEADRAEGELAQEEADNMDDATKAEEAKKTEEESLQEESQDDSENADGTDSATSDENAMESEDTPMGDEDVETSPEILERLSTMIPSTIDDITTFANNYDAPETVESVFKWDVADIFYNYFFIGGYAEVGGEDGDNIGIFNLYNPQAVECLQVYQNMNQFFSIDAKDVTYDSVLKEFIEGKTVFTVATTDAIAKIEAARAAGEFDFDYGITTLPDISSLLKSRGLSVTTAVAVNGYTSKQSAANDFASYLCSEKAADLYAKAGKIACYRNVQYNIEDMINIVKEYEKSVPLPKVVEASNYWVQLEIAFTKVWSGEDPDATLKELSDTIGAQIDEIKANLPVSQTFSAGGNKYVQ